MSKATEPPRRVFTEYEREYGYYDYIFPCDQSEVDRLDIFHHAFLEATQALYTAPVYFRHRSEPKNQEEAQNPPKRVGKQLLDLGTGTGLWVMSMAEEYPDVLAFGVDFYDFLQPREILKSTWFCGHVNVEQNWQPIYQFVNWASQKRRAEGHPSPDIDTENWDLIYARLLNGSIKDWPSLYQKIYNHLTPGFGCVELVEIDWTPRCDDDSYPPDSYFSKWVDLLNKAMDQIERPMRINPNTKNLLLEQGFVDVEEKLLKIYHNPWKRGGHEEQTGRWFNLGLTHGLQGMSLAPMTRVLGMRESDVNELVDKVRHETSLLKHHGYCNLHIWTARRPADGPGSTNQPGDKPANNNHASDNNGSNNNANSRSGKSPTTGSASGGGTSNQ